MFQFLVSAGVILLLVSGVLFLPGLVMLISGWLYKDSKMKERGLKFLAFAAVCLIVSGTLCSSAVVFKES